MKKHQQNITQKLIQPGMVRENGYDADTMTVGEILQCRAMLIGKSVMMNRQSMTLENLNEGNDGGRKSTAIWPVVVHIHVLHWRGSDKCSG